MPRTAAGFCVMIITKIERQKKNRSRFSVFVDDRYAFSVGEEVYGRFMLHQDQQLTESERQEIESAESEATVKMAALRFRSYRPRSIHEVSDHLRRKGYEDQTIQRALTYLIENKLLDDGEFARMMCRDRLKLRPVGKITMKQLLIKKGIDRSVIDSVLSEIFTEHTEAEIALRDAERKHRRIALLPPLEQKKKLYGHLVRRGYSSSLAMNIVNQLVKR